MEGYLDNMNKKTILISLVAIIMSVPLAQVKASAYSCDYGYEFNSTTNSCDPYWMDFSGNDGFTKYTQLGIQSSNSGYDSGISIKYWLEVICQHKQLLVHLYGDPLGIYANTNLYGYGSGQVKFDNQKTYGVEISKRRQFRRRVAI